MESRHGNAKPYIQIEIIEQKFKTSCQKKRGFETKTQHGLISKGKKMANAKAVNLGELEKKQLQRKS